VRPALGSRWLSCFVLALTLLSLPSELSAKDKKIKGNQDLSDWVTSGEFDDNIKFDKNNPTLWIDGDVGNVELSGELKEKWVGYGIINKSGSGTTSLSGQSEYRGDINITGGKIDVIGSGRLGNDNGGNYDGAIFVDSSGIMSFSTSASQTMSGALTGSGSFLKAGSGTLTITNSNTFSGTTTLSGNGTLILENQSALGTGAIVQSDANSILRFDTTGTITNNMTLYNFESLRNVTLSGDINAQDATYKIATGKDTIISGNITGTGKLSQVGADDANYRGTLTLTGDNNFEGDTEVDSVLNVGSATALSAQSKLKVNNGGTVKLNGFDSTVAGLEGNGAIQGSAALTAGDENDATFSGILQDGTGALAFTKQGSGTQTLTGTNTYSGTTTVSAGILEIAGSGSINAASALSIGADGILCFNTSADQNLDGVITGSGDLVKQGTGQLTISGANSFTGKATIESGLVVLNSSATAITGDGDISTADVEVTGGTLRLDADNQLADDVDISISSGEFSLNGKTESIDGLSNSGGVFSTGIGGTLNVLGNTITWSGGTNTINDAATLADTHWDVSGGTNTVEGGTTGGTLHVQSAGIGFEFTGSGTPNITLNSDNTAAGRMLLEGKLSVASGYTGTGATITSGGSGTNAGYIDLGAGTRTFEINDSASAADDLTVSAVITNGSITKTGAGTLVLSGANTYSTLQIGATNQTSNAGTVSIEHDTALGSGQLAYGSGGTLDLGVSGLTVGNNVFIGNRTDSSDYKIQLDLAGTATGELTGDIDIRKGTAGVFVTQVGADDTLTLSGILKTGVGGGAGLTKTGAGTLVLSNANTYIGATTASAGTLQLGNGGTGGSLNTGSAISIASGATFEVSQSDTVTQGTDFSGAAISGAGGFTKSGSGRTILNAANTYAGVTTISGGQIEIQNNDALGTTAGETIIGSGTKLIISNGITTAENITNVGGGQGKITGGTGGGTFTGLITLTNSIDLRGNDLTFSGGVTSTDQGFGINGARYVIDTVAIDLDSDDSDGAGALSITSASNSLANATQLNVGGNDWGFARINFGGYLKLGVDNAMPVDAGVEFGWSTDGQSSGTLDLGGYNQEVAFLRQTSFYGGVNGDQNITNSGSTDSSLTINTAAGTYDFHGRITDGATNSMSIVKDGVGTQIFDNNSGTASSYSGTTTVNGGVLQIGDNDGTGDTASTLIGDIVINSGGTLRMATDAFNQFSLTGAPTVTINDGGVMETVSTNNNAHNLYGALILNGGTLTSSGGTFGGGNWIFNDGVTVGGSTVSTISATSIGIKNNSAFNVADATGDASTDLLVSSIIEDTGGGTNNLTKTGAGTMELSAANTFTGNVLISGGTLATSGSGGGRLGANSVGRTVTVDGATSVLDVASTNAFVVNHSTENDITLVAQNGGIIRNSSGALNRIGDLTLDGSTLEANVDNGNWGSWYFGTRNSGQDATVTVSGSAASTISGSGNIALGANTQFNVADATGDAATDLTVSAILATGSSAGHTGGFTKLGAGTMELSGANTYTGDTTISAGTLKLSGGGLLGSGGTYSGTLSIDGTSAFVWDGDILQVLNGTVEGSGTGGILATGTGQLRMVFGNNITYSGPVTVDGGSIQFRNTADLKGFTPNNLNIEGDGALAIQSAVGGNNRTVLNNKTWNFDNGGGTLTFNGGNHLFQGGASTHNFVVTAAGSGSSITTINSGFMNMQGSGNIEFDVADGAEDRDLTLSATFNNGLITKDGAGTLAITGSHSGSYAIDINAGTLEVGDSARLAGGTFTAAITNDGIFKHSSDQVQTLSGNISGTGAIEKIGGAALTLSGNNTYSGTTTLGDGTTANSVIVAGSTTGLSSNSAFIINSEGALKINGNDSSIGSLAGTGIVRNENATGATLTTGGDNSSTTFSGILQDGAGGGTFGLTKVGSGTMTLTGANQHTGTTTLNAGTLVLGNASAAGTGTISQTDGTSLLRLNTTGTVTNAMSLYNVESLQDVTLSGNITAFNTTYDIATGTTTTLSGDISGSGGVTKEGLGTLVLEGTNTYTGTTDINAGTLLINASNAGATSAYEINSGGTLGGTGSIGGATTLDSGGFLSPGDGGTGDTLSFLSSLDIQNASAGSLLFDLGAAGTGDTVNVTGQLSIGDGLLDLDSFAFTDLGVTSVTGTYTWNLFNVGSYDFTTLGSNTTSTPFASIKSASLAISGDFIQLTMTVPEPSSTALLGLGGIALMLRRKRS